MLERKSVPRKLDNNTARDQLARKLKARQYTERKTIINLVSRACVITHARETIINHQYFKGARSRNLECNYEHHVVVFLGPKDKTT